MEANELMINDIIKLKVDDDCYQPLKVGSVEFDESWCAMYNFERREWENAFDGFGYDMIDPIPLTAEILELNGWKENSIMLEHIEIDIMQRKDRRKWYVEVSKLEDADTYSVITLLTLHSVRFVHELQRALRLCGLCELADNFKVE